MDGTVQAVTLLLGVLIFPQGRAARGDSVPLQCAPRVSTQVFSILAADGEAAVFLQFQGEVFRHLTI